MEKSILITTPIYYVNDKPHIGHAYTTLAVDVLTRFFKLQKKEVFFLTGTDEHGAKITETARALGITPKELCDKNSELFKVAWKNLNINYDYFIRTTDKHHEKAVKKFVEKLKEKNAIYEKEYEGLYCTGCEKFLTEKELIDGLCPDHRTKPEKISEKNWFFKLKDYLKTIEELIKTDRLDIEPGFAKNEVLGLLKQGLEDFSISRQKERVKWGIDVPFDENQIIYVWVDALLNYYTGNSTKKFKEYWEKGKVIHLLAKDILKFHAIFWPAMLLAVGEKTPDEEFIHGFFTINGQKMSKTLGNVIDPNEIVGRFGVDATRYLLLSQFPFGHDGDVQESRFIEKYNADLANGLGNLVARVLTLATKLKIKSPRPRQTKRGGQKLKVIDKNIKDKISKTQKNYEKDMQNFRLYEALEEIWKLISFCDGYIEQEKPWKNPKPEKIINNLLYCISEIADLIMPFLPETSEKIKNQIKESLTSKSQKTEILFPRI